MEVFLYTSTRVIKGCECKGKKLICRLFKDAKQELTYHCSWEEPVQDDGNVYQSIRQAMAAIDAKSSRNLYRYYFIDPWCQIKTK